MLSRALVIVDVIVVCVVDFAVVIATFILLHAQPSNDGPSKHSLTG